jgi:hypothetical protein
VQILHRFGRRELAKSAYRQPTRREDVVKHAVGTPQRSASVFIGLFRQRLDSLDTMASAPSDQEELFAFTYPCPHCGGPTELQCVGWSDEPTPCAGALSLSLLWAREPTELASTACMGNQGAAAPDNRSGALTRTRPYYGLIKFLIRFHAPRCGPRLGYGRGRPGIGLMHQRASGSRLKSTPQRSS